MSDIQDASHPHQFDSTLARRVYICANGNCANRETAHHIFEQLLALADQYRAQSIAANLLKCKLVGCLNICKNGPTMVIHPDGIFYHSVNDENLKQIFFQHLLRNQPITNLIYHHQSPPF